MQASRKKKQTGGLSAIRQFVTRCTRLLTDSAERNDRVDTKKRQLQMVWPLSRLGEPPVWTVPEGYVLRTYQPGDEPGFFRLMDRAGFKGWDMEKFQPWLQKVLPNGFFFVVLQRSGDLVATAMATHHPSPLHPFGGELGWVAGDPAHQGKGLGYVVCAAVTRRFLEAGYKRIYLQTDDWRLPALKTYLKLGWVPFLFQEDMPGRWKAVCETLGWPYTPEAWPTV